MASPQKENGHTRIANELLEQIIRAGLSGNELAVVLFVIRESYGWNKKATRPLEAAEMRNKTDIPLSSVKLAISILVEAQILSRSENGGWALNKDYETWIPVRGRAKRGASPLAAKNSPLAFKASPLAAKNSPLTTYKEKLHTEIQGKKTTASRDGAPRRTAVSDVIEVYKFLKRIGYMEVADAGEGGPAAMHWEKIEQVHYAWNQANYKIYARSAKKLLDAFGGDLDAAKVYMTTRADEWNEKGLDSWELHGMARDAHNFVAKEKTKDAEADSGGARQLRGPLGEGPAGALGAPGGGLRDGGEGSRRRFTSAGELAGRALDGLRPLGDQ